MYTYYTVIIYLQGNTISPYSPSVNTLDYTGKVVGYIYFFIFTYLSTPARQVGGLGFEFQQFFLITKIYSNNMYINFSIFIINGLNKSTLLENALLS